MQKDQLILPRRPDIVMVNKNERSYRVVNFAVYSDNRVKLKESEKKDKLIKLWNIRVMVIPIVIGALGTITKGLVQGQEHLEIRGLVETIQTTGLLRSVRIPRRVLET